MVRPIAPTSFLPPLGRLASHPHVQISTSLSKLRALYFPKMSALSMPIPAVKPSKRARSHVLHDDFVPDSGYASVESESEDDDDDDEEALELLRMDQFERDFAVKWLTGLTARADTFLSPAFPIPESEADRRSATLDEAASLLSAFVAVESEDDDDTGLVRPFSFPVSEGRAPIDVRLIDAPLQSGDHTSVGLQSWASAIVLAAHICTDPSAFGLGMPTRVLELGAGTGLLSLVTAKLFARQDQGCSAAVIATDFHPEVLSNLKRNVAENFPGAANAVHVCALDWEQAACHCAHAPLDEPFPVILAADVVYAPEHAIWLRGCVERTLAPDGAFWMMLAQRSTGRHKGLVDAVDDVFPSAEVARMQQGGGTQLAVLHREDIARAHSYGRADEGGYRLYKIGWIASKP